MMMSTSGIFSRKLHRPVAISRSQYMQSANLLPDEAQRLSSLYSFDVLDTEPEDVFLTSANTSIRFGIKVRTATIAGER